MDIKRYSSRVVVAPQAREELRHKQASVLTLSSLRPDKKFACVSLRIPEKSLLSNEILSGAINITRRKKSFYDPKSRSPSRCPRRRRRRSFRPLRLRFPRHPRNALRRHESLHERYDLVLLTGLIISNGRGR